MGLDSYLRKEQYICTYDFECKEYCPPKKANIKLEFEYEDGHKKTIQDTVDICDTGGLFIEIPFAYWRKANAIHKWFVDLSGEEDKCQKIYISGKKLLELVDICKQVLADPYKADDLLPTQDGFFFGSTEYDKWYFKDLENTIKQLENVEADAEYIYQASW